MIFRPSFPIKHVSWDPLCVAAEVWLAGVTRPGGCINIKGTFELGAGGYRGSKVHFKTICHFVEFNIVLYSLMSRSKLSVRTVFSDMGQGLLT